MPLTRRTLTAALAALLLAAPQASATPADTHARPGESTAAANIRDVRSPDARDAAAANTHDLRSSDARDAANRDQSPTSSLAGTVSPRQYRNATATSPLTGSPASLANPQPVAEVSDPDSGVDWATVGLGLTASLLLLGGLAALTRRLQRVRASA